MKCFRILAAAALAAAALAASASAFSKPLVLYYSQLGPEKAASAHPSPDMGRTQFVAYVIKDAVGADIFRVENARPYEYKDYDELVEQAKKERQVNARPEMRGKLPDLSQYDTVYIGAPVWWSDYPMVFYTMFDKYDFSGKKLVAFDTNEGSGPGIFVQTLRRAEPKATVLDDCLNLRGPDAHEGEAAIRQWLSSHNLLSK